jgi:hypothetical protein
MPESIFEKSVLDTYLICYITYTIGFYQPAAGMFFSGWNGLPLILSLQGAFLALKSS